MKFSVHCRRLLLGTLLCMAGCRPSTPYVTVEGSVLGTTFRIKAQTHLPANEIYAKVMALDAEMKHSMSIFDEESLLSRINRGESDSLDGHLIYNILAADSVSRLSDGMYDITDKPLVYWSDTEDPWSIYWVHFTSDALQAFNRAYHIVPEQGPQYIPHNEKGIRIWEEMYENLSRGYSPENLMNTNLCLYHLIATFVFSQQQNQNSSSPEKAIIRETIDYMKNNLDKTIRIEDFADLNKYSVSHFSKLFRLTTGMSPIEYFIHLKMQKACQLLYTEDSRVKQIAALLGYDDPYYFSRLFKKYMNTSPETYRKSVRKIH